MNDEEQYEVDLVVLVKTLYYNAEMLRNEVLQVLESHGRYEGKIENKKPCIRIQYADSSQFHMDIASTQEIGITNDTSINIARCSVVRSNEKSWVCNIFAALYLKKSVQSRI